MFPQDNSGQKITEIVQKGLSGAIILPSNPTADAIAAAAALYLSLTKLGKTVTLACSTPPKSEFIGADKIQTTLSTSGDNLVISFPYKEGAIDKVDYNIQGTHFNLIVSPRTGFPKLDPSQVSYSYTGGTIDFIFTIDTPNLNSLGQIYTENQAQIQGKTIINIDRHLVNDFFGTVNVVNKTSSSTSELVYQILTDLSIELDRDIATNLYGGIMAATNNFTSYSVTAQTFQTAADLLRMGALKKIQSRQPGMSMSRPIAPQPQPFPPRTFQSNGSLKEFEKMTPIEDIENEPDDFEGDSTTATPQDWLKPKIFKGKGLI